MLQGDRIAVHGDGFSQISGLATNANIKCAIQRLTTSGEQMPITFLE